MIASRAVPILLWFLCAVAASDGLRNNERGGPPRLIARSSRRIGPSEYLIPPPPPRGQPPARHYAPIPIRTGRLARPTEPESGYFSRLMGWLNPFGFGSFSESVVPPAPAPAPAASFPGPYPGRGPPSVYLGPLVGGLPLGHPAGPPPYSAPPNKARGRQCNPCNKVPWLPIETGENSALGIPLPASIPPIQPLSQFPHSTAAPGYLPPPPRPDNYLTEDAHSAESQQVRTADFSHSDFGESAAIGPLPHPQLFPGPVPPLYKAEPFGGSSKGGQPAPSSPEQPQRPFSSSSSDGQPEHQIVPSNPGQVSAFETRDRYHGYSSGTVNAEPQDSAGPSQDPGRLPASFGASVSFEQRPPHSAAVSGQGYQETRNFQPFLPETDPNRRESDDLSSSGSSIVHDSRATNVREHPIQFEQSPLLDLTKKGGKENGAETSWLASTTVNPIFELNALLEDATERSPGYEETAEDSLYFAGETEESSGQATEAYSYQSFGGNSPRATYTQENGNRAAVPISSQSAADFWSGLLESAKSERNDFGNGGKVETESKPNGSGHGQRTQKPQSAGSSGPTTKRNKQVQVIIPYTSDYTPLPFQQSPREQWNLKNNPERTQPRKVAYLGEETLEDNYVSEESRNDLQHRVPHISNFTSSSSNESEYRTATTPLYAAAATTTTTTTDIKSKAVRVNNSIDVHRLQKNIDNWTIQEYSRPVTSSTVLPSSARPYLLPSKKIPEEYLTTTEPGDHSRNTEHRQPASVKTYSLAGFSFNDLEHDVAASDQVVRVQDNDRNATNQDFAWKGFSSPDEERVYVVTPLPISVTNLATNGPTDKVDSSRANKTILEEFEAIEKAYQVLPQAVNNLAVASTGKESKVPLWGIMEHEEFASLTGTDADADTDTDTDTTQRNEQEENADGPILYAGHSNVRSHNSQPPA